MELTLSRGCRHTDWVDVPNTRIGSCRSCGFCLVMSKKRLRSFIHDSIQPRAPTDSQFTSPTEFLRLKSFTHPPLDLTNGREIRVLNLKAGVHDDELRCELRKVNLQHGPVFEAMSYTWANSHGDDSICRTIRCGNENEHLGVTKSCEAALRRLRLPDADRILWIDAVCIDQTNVQERNHQVMNMIAIFRCAQRVLVYLGEAFKTLGVLLSTLVTTGAEKYQRLDLVTALKISRDCFCKDPRDKVYALTGLLQNMPIQVDYSPNTTAGLVFLQAAAWHIRTTKSLEIMSYVHGVSHHIMPSWVPDWTTMASTVLPPWLGQPKPSSNPLLIDRETQDRLEPMVPLDYPLNCVLRVLGRKLGTVWVIPDILEPPKPTVDSLPMARSNGPADPLDPDGVKPEFLCMSWKDYKPAGGQLSEFWNRIQRSHDDGNQYRGRARKLLGYLPDIPPAFGGPCSSCFSQATNALAPAKSASGSFGPKISLSMPCNCRVRSISSAHYSFSDFWEFTMALKSHSNGKKIFGTEQSLGFGPMRLQHRDEGNATYTRQSGVISDARSALLTGCENGTRAKMNHWTGRDRRLKIDDRMQRGLNGQLQRFSPFGSVYYHLMLAMPRGGVSVGELQHDGAVLAHIVRKQLREAEHRALKEQQRREEEQRRREPENARVHYNR
ncbi:heterokaryon incompatibility protein-domain-containing protein [Dactylonectria estremocensis]|uniref:Heterokaryon incompatibility protein-domain-containing protein n=1 Tax=Dactylonectria estremocensis TaxID=1079267 RepID=A0A9P9IFB2_9HYPO|nr:heterokaryon incompatibility protein-domain-containing protein [Dactylonectria estremocensis]